MMVPVPQARDHHLKLHVVLATQDAIDDRATGPLGITQHFGNSTMSARPKSDLPLTTHILTWLDSLFEKRTPEPEKLASVSVDTAPEPVHAHYSLSPLASLSCDSSGDPLNGVYDIGFSLMRSKENSKDGKSPSSKKSSSITKLSLAAASIMSYAPQETPAAAKGSRRRLSDAAASKLRFLKQLPSLVAEHQQVINKVQKLQLTGALDLSSNKYSAEAIWFVNWEGQPARVKCKWNESSSNSLLFDAVVGLRNSPHKLKVTGHPHKLNSASLIMAPGKSRSSSSSTATLDIQPLSSSSGSSSSREVDDSNPAPEQQPVCKAFDQPGLQIELGYNLAASTPIISASRRFGSSSSSWQIRQVKAAYDGKSSNVALSAAGTAWNVRVVFPTESTGLLGLPKAPAGGSLWPKLMLQLTPDVSFDTL